MARCDPTTCRRWRERPRRPAEAATHLRRLPHSSGVGYLGLVAVADLPEKVPAVACCAHHEEEDRGDQPADRVGVAAHDLRSHPRGNHLACQRRRKAGQHRPTMPLRGGVAAHPACVGDDPDHTPDAEDEQRESEP
jgi:hypothetical protein